MSKDLVVVNGLLSVYVEEFYIDLVGDIKQLACNGYVKGYTYDLDARPFEEFYAIKSAHTPKTWLIIGQDSDNCDCLNLYKVDSDTHTLTLTYSLTPVEQYILDSYIRDYDKFSTEGKEIMHNICKALEIFTPDEYYELDSFLYNATKASNLYFYSDEKELIKDLYASEKFQKMVNRVAG